MLTRDLGIDLGTASVLIFVRGRGVVLEEPSIAAIDRQSGQLLAVGNAAQELIGRTPGTVAAIRPLRDGVISDYETTLRMMKSYIKKALGGNPFKPNVVVSVPSGISEVEERAVIEAGMSSGARRVYLIEESVAAAIGAGVDISRPVGSMIIDIGGGTSDIAVLSLGRIVESQSIKAAGDHFDAALIRHIRRKFGAIISTKAAQDTKHRVGCVLPREETLHYAARGRDLETGFPKTCEISSEDTREAYTGSLQEIIEEVGLVLERTPPELVSDIARDGILLSGGGSQLYGLAQAIAEAVKIPTTVAADATHCVALGTGQALSHLQEMPEGALHIARRRKLRR